MTGHRPRVVKRGGQWVVRCQCAVMSTRIVSWKVAMQFAAAHLELVQLRGGPS